MNLFKAAGFSAFAGLFGSIAVANASADEVAGSAAALAGHAGHAHSVGGYDVTAGLGVLAAAAVQERGERGQSGRGDGRGRGDRRRGDARSRDDRARGRGHGADRRRVERRTDRRYDRRREVRRDVRRDARSDIRRRVRRDARRQYEHNRARRAYTAPRRAYTGRRYGHGYSGGGHGYFCADHGVFHYFRGYDPFGFIRVAAYGRPGYRFPRDCYPVERVDFYRGRRALIGGIMCYDAFGYSYIRPGSRYVKRYLY